MKHREEKKKTQNAFHFVYLPPLNAAAAAAACTLSVSEVNCCDCVIRLAAPGSRRGRSAAAQLPTIPQGGRSGAGRGRRGGLTFCSPDKVTGPSLFSQSCRGGRDGEAGTASDDQNKSVWFVSNSLKLFGVRTNFCVEIKVMSEFHQRSHFLSDKV